MESETGSGENAKNNQESATIGARFLELARTVLKAIFKNKWLQKLKLFRKEKFSEEVEHSKNQNALDQKIERGVKNSTFGIKMTILKTEKKRATQKLDERLEIQREVNRLRKDLRDKYINFQGLNINKDYKTIVVARQEVRNIFGKLKSSRDVIIGFHTHFHMANKENSAALCAIDELKKYQHKSNWKVYEIEISPNQTLEGVLKSECQNFKIDPNLINRINEIKQKHKKVIDRLILTVSHPGDQSNL